MWRNRARLVKYGPVETAIGFAVGILADFNIDDNIRVFSPARIDYAQTITRTYSEY